MLNDHMNSFHYKSVQFKKPTTNQPTNQPDLYNEHLFILNLILVYISLLVALHFCKSCVGKLFLYFLWLKKIRLNGKIKKNHILLQIIITIIIIINCYNQFVRLKSLKLIPLSEKIYITYSEPFCLGNFNVEDQTLIVHVNV